MQINAPRRNSLENLVGVSFNSISDRTTINDILVSAIVPNRAQPRTEFNDETIRELAESIRNNGLLEPILVRPTQKSHDETSGAPPQWTYELVAGERRLRAFKHLRRETIPAVIRNVSDSELRTFALIENLQREDLTVADKALSINELAKEVGGVEKAAQKLSMSRANAFRYARIAKSHHETQAIIRSIRLDLVAADLLVSLTEKAEKEGRLPAFFESAKSEILDGAGVILLQQRFFGVPPPSAKRLNLDTTSKKIDGAISKSPFWKTDRKAGLALTFDLNKSLKHSEKTSQIRATEQYFKALGAKKVEISF